MATALLHRTKTRDFGTNGITTAENIPFADATMLAYDPFRRFFSQLDPEINVLRTEQGFEVEIPVAGFKPEHVNITVKDHVVSLAAKNDRRAFTRLLRLPEDIDPERVEAKIEDGLLVLSLLRYPQSQPRKIEIRTG